MLFLKKNFLKKIVLCVVIVLSLLIVSKAFKNTIDFQTITANIENLGLWGPISYTLLYIAISGILIPSIIFKIFAGTFFGITNGIIIITVASTISSLIKFLFARYLFRDDIVKKINQNPKWLKIDQLIEKEGWKVLILLRNIPVANALFLNYICGVTRMSAFEFSWASLIGRLPTTALYVYFGFFAAQTTGLNASIGSLNHSIAPWILWIGLISTALFSFYAIHLSKKLYLKF